MALNRQEIWSFRFWFSSYFIKKLYVLLSMDEKYL